MSTINRPTDTAQKEKDINQKLQLYGIYQAFSNGKAPSNKQIDVALNSALESKALSSPSGKLSEDGRKLVADLKEVIRQAKYLLLTKNEGDLLQEFVWDTRHLDGGSTKLPSAPTDKATAQQHGNEALDGLKTLGRLVLSNGQFRKLLNDATILIRDMAGDAAQSAANRVNPSQEQLNQIDRPAEDNTWHDVPGWSKENLKNQARAAYDKNKPFRKEQVQEAINEGLDTAQPQPTQDTPEAGRVGVATVTENLKRQAKENIPDERQEDAKKAKSAAMQHSKDYWNKKMPQERRDQTIWRMKKMVAEIQGHSDYQQAIETLLTLAETYGGHANNLFSQSTGTVQGAHDDIGLRSAEANLKTLIERFANSTSTDDFFDSLNDVYKDAERDPELKNWFKRIDKFVRKCLQEQGFIVQDAANEEWNRLYDQGHFLLRERYRNRIDRILNEIKFLADQFDQDPQNKTFGQAVQNFFLDLGNDENGKHKFKKNLVKDLTEVIIPGIFENTRYVPIPRIEVADPMIDAVVDNLVIESDNLFPNVLEFGSDNYFRMGRRGIKNKKENKVMIAGSGIQMDLRDVAYYVKKKRGFPSITDKGVMDIFLGGEGFSFKIAARNAQQSDRAHFVAVDKVDVTLKNLNVKIKQSNHKLLFTIAKPLLLKTIRPVIQKVLEKQIKESFMQADAFSYGIHQDVQRGVEAAKGDPENAANIYQSYIHAVRKKMAEKKTMAQEVTSKTNVNMAMTQQDSIFKHISLQGGISTKATEYKELAAKGDRWESPVFSIGSANESTDIPKLTPLSRKPHSTANGTIRGGNHPNSEGSVANTTTTGPSSGFSNQVDHAFDTQKVNTAPKVTNATANMSNGSTAKTY
ncbi:uncharacterized protein Z518_03270 [Rhinocladiella mackenziei CBS 650.93]|uniref:Rhinocladiella mackenziei CBS 650.93 unplaced genomic scaffold supercont1.2, whole genome shotgun sequence n=1 Tax=Rhinocladiella mackenziei CBS 650.93 TaxID=1442369 RepID=A0A0D2IRK7_9EURO|nr:uncharacterized protein Z518_03270 [Rhinocladiella mackenziei CBS 650.93]KIX08614.1 hypothetical protein Z518_03270 [Rhinocladiella mackenziei CBS 650.93]